MTLADLDLPSQAAVLGWLATYLIHSTLWLSSAWLLARWVRGSAWSERLWKSAVLGGLVSATLVALLDVSGSTWSMPNTGATRALDRGWLSSSDPPIATVVPSGPEASARASDEPLPPSVAGPDALPAPGRARGLALPPWTTTLLAFWLIGAVLALAHLAWLHMRLRRALARRKKLPDGALVVRLERLRKTAGSKRSVQLSFTAHLPSPVALARGEIVVPERALERLSEAELDTLLAHELAHLERRDPWWLLALSALQRLFFVQPLNRLAAKRAAEAAELRCDELAAAWTQGALPLARCLAEVASWIERSPAPRIVAGMAHETSALVERVERLLAPRPVQRRQGLLVGAWLAGSLLALSCGGPQVSPGEAQQATQPAPEEGEVSDGELSALRALGYLTTSVIPLQRESASGSESAAAVRLGLAEIEAEIAEHRAKQASLKPAHPAWQLAEQEIEKLDIEREALILGPRPDTFDFKEPVSRLRAGMHAITVEQGVTYLCFALAHALRLHADGSIDCGPTRLVAPGSPDDEALVAHLAEIAAGMPSEALDPALPASPALPGGTLTVLIDVEAPYGLMYRVLQACSRETVRIRRFSLIAMKDGALGAPVPFALPRDLERQAQAEAVFELDPPRRRIEIRMRVAEPAKSHLLVLATLVHADGRLEIVPQLHDPLEYRVRWQASISGELGEIVFGPRRDSSGGTDGPTPLESVEATLQGLHAAMPEARIEIGADPGTVYAEVKALLDAVRRADFTDIVFTGTRAP